MSSFSKLVFILIFSSLLFISCGVKGPPKVSDDSKIQEAYKKYLGKSSEQDISSEENSKKKKK